MFVVAAVRLCEDLSSHVEQRAVVGVSVCHVAQPA